MRLENKERFVHINVGMLILSIAIQLLFVITGCSLDEGDSAPTVKNPTVTINLKEVPAGSFQRDSTTTNISVITFAFRMSDKEITRAQFSAIMGTDPSDSTRSSGSDDPVQRVNWYHAIAFCNKLSIVEGLTPVYSVSGVNFNTLVFGDIPIDNTEPAYSTWNAATANWSADGYRLPTEMEWMWAAMGAVDDYTKPFAGSNGSNAIGDYAVFGYNSGDTGATTTQRSNQVSSKLPNELGLYDMSGNIWEWNWDWYNLPYPAGTLTDYPGVATGTYRVARGGSWSFPASYCTVAIRFDYNPYNQFSSLGFRVVRP